MSLSRIARVPPADYVGELYAVRLRSGRVVDVTPCALGIVPGVGLVVASDRSDLEARAYLPPLDGVPWRRISAVFYRRRRPEYGPGDEWVHDVSNTEAQISPEGVAFRHPVPMAPALICPSPPGNFICEG